MLFKTPHGSYLYGTAHAGSDLDFYVVVEPTGKRKYAEHSIVDGIDTTTVDLTTFLRFAQRGVPQALEAMFSPLAIYDSIGYLRNSFYADIGSETRERYESTIYNFCKDDNYKKKRHALRLGMNYADLRRYGRFNPVLRPVDIECITSLANLSGEVVYQKSLDIAYGDTNGPISISKVT